MRISMRIENSKERITNSTKERDIKKGDIVGDYRIIEIRKYVLGHTYLWQKIKKQTSTNTAGG